MREKIDYRSNNSDKNKKEGYKKHQIERILTGELFYPN
jgi:hypothetical protein